MGTRRSKGSWVKRVVDTAHGRDTATRPAQDGSFGVSGSGTGFRGVFNKTAQLTSDFIAGDRGGSPSQSLKIAKEKAPEQKKKPLSLAKTVATPKKKLTGAKPASAVAGSLGSASGGSVRL